MDIQFANPLWFWGLLALIPLVCLRLWSHFRAAKRLPGLVSPRLRTQLISGSSQFQRWLVFAFLAISLACLIVALARPQWGFEESETESEGRNLLIAIDTSRSMLANDLLPNRMLRAKLAAKDILAALPEDRIGLIAFAGRAFLQAPLTVDHDAVAEAIDQLDTDIIPRGGTNLTAAAEVALEAFEESFLEESALVIFSDGEALEGTDQIEAIKTKADTAGMTIVTVGVGTPGGAIIPEIDPETGAAIPGVFIKDENGQVVRTRLDEGALRSLASGKGAYIQLGNAASLTAVVERITSTIATSRQEEQARSRPIERFMWPLGFATGFMILSFLTPLLFLKRRPKPMVIEAKASLSPTLGVAFLFLVSTSARSADTMTDGFEAFQRGDYDQAIEIYRSLESKKVSSRKEAEIQLSLGASAYQKGDFEAAETSFSKTLTAPGEKLHGIAHYNLGNTLFRKGETLLQSASGGGNPDQLQPMNGSGATVESTIRQWESAIEHYESAIARNAHGDKAAFNIEVVKKRIEELLKEAEEQEQQEGEEKDENSEEQESEDGEEGEEEESEDGQENPEDSENDQGDGEEQENQDSEGQNDPNEEEEQNSGQQDDSSENEQDQPQNGGEEEPGEPEPPQDGKLEANPDEPQDSPQPSQEQMQQQQQRNSQTGYSPSEARQLLEALADETEVRPVMKPAPNEKFRNW